MIIYKVINLPLPSPTPFTLTSNADNPDEDGIFMLYWSSSEYGDVYSVYCDNVLLEWGITKLYCNIKVYSSGSYDFKVVALNDYGQTDSNEITVNVDIYIVEPEPNPIGENDSCTVYNWFWYRFWCIRIGYSWCRILFEKS